MTDLKTTSAYYPPSFLSFLLVKYQEVPLKLKSLMTHINEVMSDSIDKEKVRLPKDFTGFLLEYPSGSDIIFCVSGK